MPNQKHDPELLESVLAHAGVGPGADHVDLRKIGSLCGIDLYIDVGKHHDQKLAYENFTLAQDALFHAFVQRGANNARPTARP